MELNMTEARKRRIEEGWLVVAGAVHGRTNYGIAAIALGDPANGTRRAKRVIPFLESAGVLVRVPSPRCIYEVQTRSRQEYEERVRLYLGRTAKARGERISEAKGGQKERTEDALERIERKLDRLLAELGVSDEA